MDAMQQTAPSSPPPPHFVSFHETGLGFGLPHKPPLVMAAAHEIEEPVLVPSIPSQHTKREETYLARMSLRI